MIEVTINPDNTLQVTQNGQVINLTYPESERLRFELIRAQMKITDRLNVVLKETN